MSETARKALSFAKKVKVWLHGPPGNEAKAGTSMSSAAPESDFKPRAQPLGSSCEDVDDATPAEPDWIKTPWGRYRKIQFGSGCGSGMLEDEPQLPRRPRRLISLNDPFDRKER